MTLDDTDLVHLRRCVELAREALADGDEPFGSLLVDASGEVRFEDRNRVKGGDETRHPEFEIAKWSATHLTADERATATVYTSGEHCPMCSAAHGWMGLGRIVYAGSTAQLGEWFAEWGVPPSASRTLIGRCPCVAGPRDAAPAARRRARVPGRPRVCRAPPPGSTAGTGPGGTPHSANHSPSWAVEPA